MTEATGIVTTMNNEAIRKLVEDIETLHFDGEPRSQISSGKPDHYIFITANQCGLVRLARSFLIAALSPPDKEAFTHPPIVDEPDSQILNSPSDLAIGWIHHAEVVPIPDDVILNRKRDAWTNDRFALYGCGFIAFVLLFLLMSGVCFWTSIIAGNPRWKP